MKQIRGFFEKQGFFILLAVCIGVIVASGIWAMSIKEKSGDDLPTDASGMYAQRLEEAEKLRMICPVKGKTLRAFSSMAWLPGLAQWGAHEAMDIAAEIGVSAQAAKEGIVSAAFRDKLWGAVVEISHADGLVTRYCGLKWPLPVKTGESVAMKQAIGQVGIAEVEAVDGPHLHFEALLNGVPLDAAMYMIEN